MFWICTQGRIAQFGTPKYKHFDARETGWTKVVLKPGMAEAKKGKAASAGQEK